MPENAPTDCTQRPPRSARTTLGGYALLPRMLDKGRADIAGKSGEYHFACPLDQQFLTFVGVEADEVKKLLAEGKGDGEVLAWIQQHAKIRREPWEIAAWTAWQAARVPTSLESRDFFSELHKASGKDREDIGTWFEMLDLDDYVTFGGKA